MSAALVAPVLVGLPATPAASAVEAPTPPMTSVIGDARVDGLGVAPDGSLRVMTDGGLLKVSPTGEIDATFGGDGSAPVVGGERQNDHVAVLSDGSSLVVTADGLTKVGPTGAVDFAYGEGGTALVADLAVNAEVLVRPGGGALVHAGSGLVALTEGGDADASFTYAGVSHPDDVAVLSTGLVAVAGEHDPLELTVLGTDGALAQGFGPDPSQPGRIDLDVGDGSEAVVGTFARPDGGLVVALDGDNDLLLVAVDEDGQRDEAFGVVALPGRADVRSGFVDAAGRVTIEQRFIIRFGLSRVDALGEVDADFGRDGHRYVGYDHLTSAVGPAGTTYLALDEPSTAAPAQWGGVLRLTDDGGADGAFGGDGYLPIGAPSEVPARLESATHSSDGSTLLLWTPSTPDRGESFVTRSIGGQTDPSFGVEGRARVPIREDEVDSRVRLVDASGEAFYVVPMLPIDQGSVSRFSAAGDLDLSYAGDGRAELRHRLDSSDIWLEPTLLDDGGLLVGEVALDLEGLEGTECCTHSLVTVTRLDASGAEAVGYDPPQVVVDSGDLTMTSKGTSFFGAHSELLRFASDGNADDGWVAPDLGALTSCGVDNLEPWRADGVLVTLAAGCEDGDEPMLVAFDAHGHPDAVLGTPVTGVILDERWTDVQVDSHDRILLSHANEVRRLLPNGEPDLAFGTKQIDGTLVASEDRIGVVNSTSSTYTELDPGPAPAPLVVSLPSAPKPIAGTYRTAAGDFDGDGTDDILWYAPGTGGDSIWYGQHPGGFRQERFTITRTYEPVAGDFNGDGRTDLLLYGAGSAPDVLWTAKATGGFSSSSVVINGTYRPVVGDFGGDGRDDVLWYAPGTGADRLWTAKPGGGFSTSSVRIDGTYVPVPADVNGDERTDIVWYGEGSRPDSLWTARSSGGFTSSPLSVAGRYRPFAGDLNGDGLDDLVWYAPGSATDRIWLARAAGGFQGQPLTVAGTYRPIVGDFDGDSLADVFWYGPGTAADRLAFTKIA